MGRPSFPPRTQAQPAKKRDGAQLVKRQYVRFAFYKIDPMWRRLPSDKQEAQKRELLDTIKGFGRRMLLRPYSLMGTRADAELLLWQIAESIDPFQELAVAIMNTQMGGYLKLTTSYLSQTKRSIYEIRDDVNDDEMERLVIDPSEAKYLFVYPFIKTRPWYQLSLPARQGIMDEHIIVGRNYPSIKLNTTYSFGLDDQEFVLAFETDEPSDFLDLVQDLRETESSMYTLEDTPLFTCVNMSLARALDALGGPAIALPEEEEKQQEVWIDWGPVENLPPGSSETIFLEGQMVAIFNVNGDLYAINNRCSHARGPLSEGDVEVEDDGMCTVTCPWHYGKFDLATGKAVDGMVSRPVAKYEIDVRDGVIWVGRVPQDEA